MFQNVLFSRAALISSPLIGSLREDVLVLVSEEYILQYADGGIK